MTLIRRTAGADGAAHRTGAGRAVAVLVLVALAALIPLLGPSAALHGTGEAAAPGAGGIALLRGVLFAALCVPLGEQFVLRLVRRLPGAPPDGRGAGRRPRTPPASSPRWRRPRWSRPAT